MCSVRLLCEYALEEPSTLLVDVDDLGGECNANHRVMKRNTV